MIASTGGRRGTVLACAALALLLAAGCTKKSTSPGPQGSVSGRVIHAGGRPAPNVDVTLTAISGTLASLDLVVADTLGRFAFTRLSPGSFVLYSRDFADSCAADTVVVPNVSGNPAADTVSAVLTLLPGGTLIGTATLAGRGDSQGIVVYVDHLLTLATADSASGAYRLGDVPAGNWTLRVTRTGFADATLPVAIPTPGDSVQVAPVTLQPGTATGIAGLSRLLRAAGNPHLPR